MNGANGAWIADTTLLLLIIFYGAYLGKMWSQGRQGITTNVMIKGKKSRRARGLGVVLTAVTYVTAAVELISCVCMHVDGAAGAFAGIPLGVRLAGVLLVALGDAFFIAAFLTLRGSWRAGIDESQRTELVTSGIYRYSRNPAFVGFDLTCAGCVLAVGNVWMAVCAVLEIGVMHMQILEEEAHLTRMFGEPYASYRRRVGRYITLRAGKKHAGEDGR